MLLVVVWVGYLLISARVLVVLGDVVSVDVDNGVYDDVGVVGDD